MANAIRVRSNTQGGKVDAGKAAGTFVLPAVDVSITDAAITNASATITSASNPFDAALHVGAPIDGPAGIPAGTYITAVGSAGSATMSQNATATATAQTATLHASEVLQSPALANFPAIDSTKHAVITLDPDGVFGAPEAAWITLHTGTNTWAQILRGQEGSTARAHFQDEDWVHGQVASDFGDYGLIGLKSYALGTDTSYAITSTTFADVDATNLSVTFTAPPSGRVLVRLTGLASEGASGGDCYWDLREGTTDLTSQIVLAQANLFQVVSPVFLITGLVAGSSHTYKWGARINVSGTSHGIWSGPTFGNLLMEVQGLNV